MKLIKSISRVESSIFKIGSIYAICVMFFSAFLYYYYQEHFSIFSHWFSNMGVGSTGWSFNRGLQGTAIFYSIMIIYFIYSFTTGKKISKTLIGIGTIFGIIAVVGIFILTENTMLCNQPVHDMGALMYFIATPIYCSIITMALALEGKKSKMQWILTIALVIFSISIAPLIYLIANNIGLDPSQALGSMDRRFAVARFFEWASVFLFFIWIYNTGMLLKKTAFDEKDKTLGLNNHAIKGLDS